MNGYLMHEQNFVIGEDTFIETFAPENNYGVVFEDDGETAYFYAVEKDKDGHGLVILDALHVYESGEKEDVNGNMDMEKKGDAGGTKGPAASKLLIVWSKDWLKCALVIDGFCHALFDFAAHGGYNINEFPPPNDFWTKGDRKLTEEVLKGLF